MNKILLEEKYILEYIRDSINDFKIRSVEINNAKYHHNTSYSFAPLILKHGILSQSELNRLGIKKYSSEVLKLLSDTDSHVNGIDDVSLSVVGLTDLYRDEMEYNPYDPSSVDFTISNDIQARRSTIHYGNEFLCHKNIDNDKLKSVDVRILKLIELTLINKKDSQSIKNIIDKYNCLKNIALAIKQYKLDIPFREMSQDNLTMDVDKVSKAPQLILKQDK